MSNDSLALAERQFHFPVLPGAAGGMPVRALPEDGRALDVVLIRDGKAQDDGGCAVELRQDFHTLFWMRRGAGRQIIDGVSAEVSAPSLTVVGRGQVYRYAEMEGVEGALVSFGDDLLYEGPVTRVNPVWLLGRYGAQTVPVPEADAERLDELIRLLTAESQRPEGPLNAEVHRHLLLTLLLWTQRYYDEARAAEPAAEDSATGLHRRFVAVLERDFARHHDVDHYADALAVPAPLLARALSDSTGRTTKALITDRVMLEAARLLRFTDLQIGEVAVRVGLRNQFYFSRAFKRRHGESPQAYRARTRAGA